jgi:CheY-like chemotaxis protein
MNVQKINYFYYPTKIIFLDDDENYLNSLPFYLNQNLNPMFFSSSVDFMSHINNSCSTDISNNLIKKNTGVENDGLESGYLNFPAIHEKLYNPDRFDEISVAVIDYAMKETDGLTVCSALDAFPIKKILLTGQATTDTGLNAFNKELIDKFIEKGSKTIKNELNQAIHKLQQQYFENTFNQFSKHLPSATNKILKNNDYIKLFNETLKEKSICEYYLLDKSGSFLLISDIGEVYFLIISTISELEIYHAIAKEAEAPKIIIDILAKKDQLLYFYTEDIKKEPVCGWKDYFFPALKLSDDSDYLYALVEGKNIKKFNTSFQSYNDYLEKKPS